MNVDYTQAEPSQWWYLIKSYCDRTDPAKRFTKTIKCGELYFWMAEMSGAFEISELENLAHEAIEKATKVKRRKNNLPQLDTAEDSNLLIRDFCFDRIKRIVELS